MLSADSDSRRWNKSGSWTNESQIDARDGIGQVGLLQQGLPFLTIGQDSLPPKSSSPGPLPMNGAESDQAFVTIQAGSTEFLSNQTWTEFDPAGTIGDRVRVCQNEQ